MLNIYMATQIILKNFLDEAYTSSFFFDFFANKFKEIRSKMFQKCFKNGII